MADRTHMAGQPPLEMPTGDAFRDQLARIACNRHSPEAAALYRVLFDYVQKRVRRTAASARLQVSEQEEIVGEVLLQLMKGSLASFRGGSLPELLGFVRTISDRAVWRVVRSHERERNALETAGMDGMERWTGEPPKTADSVEVLGESPLEEKDQQYLLELLRAGSKAEYARRAGVSRAAVTQRVKRIRDRIESLTRGEQLAHEVWLEQQARAVAAFED
ncbi:MAG: hypothetical protein H6737_03040 [Alphaproteobacteria bacterium]|nr:hypothetical protein [Alphaproteobacteria bacterium]